MGEGKLPRLCPGWNIDSFFKRNFTLFGSKKHVCAQRPKGESASMKHSVGIQGGRRRYTVKPEHFPEKLVLRPKRWPTFWDSAVQIQSGIGFWGKHCQVIGVANSNVQVKNCNYD